MRYLLQYIVSKRLTEQLSPFILKKFKSKGSFLEYGVVVSIESVNGVG